MIGIAVVVGLFPLLGAAQDLEARKERMTRRVEEIRGLSFAKPLALRRGTRKEYARFFLRSAKAIYGEDLDAAERFLKAAGFLPSRMRLPLAITAQAMRGREAYCDDGALIVLDPAIPDDLLLSNLTTGLLDQRFPVAGRRTRAGRSFDAQVALVAVRSGDPHISKHLFYYGKKMDEPLDKGFLPDFVRKTIEWERKGSRFQSAVVPRLFVRFGSFGYQRGSIFVERLREKGGRKLVDRAQEDPPRSTEQILHPEKYLAGELPIAIDITPVEDALKTAGYRAIYRTTLGEFGTAVFFETHLRDDDSAPLAAGWGGDTIALFAKGKEEILVWATEWDSEGDAEEFRLALLRVSQRQLPKEKDRTNVVVRRKTACAWLVRYPMRLQDALLDALWRSTKGGKAPYGR